MGNNAELSSVSLSERMLKELNAIREWYRIGFSAAQNVSIDNES